MLLLLSVSFKTTKAQAQAANIGDISELNGSAQIVRDKPYVADLDFAIQSNDEAITTNGRMAITFLDDSQVKLTEHSQLIIDEYIYDPDPSKAKMALTFGLGTARFITGKLATINKENIFIETPSATVGIRGTDFTITIDELGRSLIILLPTDEGLPSGEIVVSTAMGEVVLNQPYQATSVSTFESKPAKPVILDITTELIDNMLIVSPPKEEIILTEDSTNTQTNNILDVDYLEFEDLDVDYLQDNALEFTELDINYLDVNFLEDLLNIIEEIDELDETESLLRTAINLSGTQVGYDAETQINTFITDQYITFYRSLEHTVKLDLDKAGAYTVLLIQNGKSTQIVVNGGGSSVIKITQGS